MVSDAIRRILQAAKAKRASDVHICAGAPIVCRVGKDRVPISDKPLGSDTSKKLSYELLSEEQIKQFEKLLDYDLMLADEEGRYRVNINFNDGNVGAIIRILPGEPKSIEEPRLPPIVKTLCYRTKGFTITTGAKYGMMTMKQSLARLVEERVIAEEVAQSVLANYGG